MQYFQHQFSVFTTHIDFNTRLHSIVDKIKERNFHQKYISNYSKPSVDRLQHRYCSGLE